ASVLIGVLSFAIPFAVVWLFAQFVFGWPPHQAQIAGIALSTTSVAVVYAVMIEGGFSDTAMGKMILAACFITDFGTVLALGTLFANYNFWLLLFVIVTLIVLWFMPRWTQSIIMRLGATQVSEPEVKFIFFVLFLLGGHTTHGHGPDIWNHFLFVWLAKRDHRPESVHHSRQRRDFERIRADVDRTKVFPAEHRDDAGVGSPLSPAAGDPFS